MNIRRLTLGAGANVLILADPLVHWDELIRDVSTQVGSIADRIVSRHPTQFAR